MLRLDNGDICQHMKGYNNSSMDFFNQSSQNLSPHKPMSKPTHSNGPLTPHTRHTSLTENPTSHLELPSLSALKMNPHRSLMSIDSLITPPNSEETKQINSFDQIDAPHDGAGPDVLFPSPSNQSANLHLFNSSSTQAPGAKTATSNTIATQELSPEQEQMVQDWSRRDGPHWPTLQSNGTQRPRGVKTWDSWVKYEAMDGRHLSKPTEEEYRLVANFLNGLKTSDPASWSTHPPVISPPHKKRKVMQDNTPKRRSLVDIAPSSRKRSTTPSVYGDATTHPSLARRRASRTNPKNAGAETKSARAPSSKPAKDPHWYNYTDYAPDFEQHAPADAMTCANNAHKFDNKDNKKGPRDLATDPERGHLSAAELTVASWLHLDCHRYLTSKRQIFKGFVEHLKKKQDVSKRVKEGLEEAGQTKLTNWNKTEAQKLLGIDVSKGSYIWSFYKDLGWFEDDALHMYAEHLEE